MSQQGEFNVTLHHQGMTATRGCLLATEVSSEGKDISNLGNDFFTNFYNMIYLYIQISQNDSCIIVMLNISHYCRSVPNHTCTVLKEND